MASKKLKRALGAALLGFGASKALGAMGAKKEAIKKAASITTDPDMGSEMANDTMLAKSMRNSMLKKKTVLPKKKPSMGNSMSDLSSVFGLGPYDGAKKGKMIKARGGRLVNLKPTKLY